MYTNLYQTYRSVLPQIPNDTRQRRLASLNSCEVSPSQPGFRVKRLVLEERLAEISAPARGQMRRRIGRIQASGPVIPVTLTMLQT